VEDLEVARESGNADQRGREEARAYRGGRSAEGHAGWDFLPCSQESRRPQEEVSAARSTERGAASQAGPRSVFRTAPPLPRPACLVKLSRADPVSRNLKRGAACGVRLVFHWWWRRRWRRPAVT